MPANEKCRPARAEASLPARRTAALTTTTGRPAATTPIESGPAFVPVRSGTRLVDIQSPATQAGAVQSRNCPVCLGRVGHLDEGEAARTAGVPVRHQADALYRPMGLEKRTDRIFCCPEIQVADENLLQGWFLFHLNEGFTRAAPLRGPLKREQSNVSPA